LKYPVYRPSIGALEKQYVDEALDSSWISSKGAFIAKFESAFAEFTQARYATSVANGTAAVHLAVLAAGIGPGDEVIVPTLTYVASVNAIAYTGATPVFVDSLPDSWQLDPDDVRRKIGARTRAIMAVHLYGHPCDMDALTAIAAEHRLLLIEDCAEAFGSFYKGRHVGNFGQIAAYSFFGNKTITTGEGGMVVTNDATLYGRAVHFKGQGLAPRREYWHDVIGYNYRMTNVCAAIGYAQMQRAPEFIAKKREIADWYRKDLRGVPVDCHGTVGDVRHSYWMFSVLVDSPEKRDPLRAHLAGAGIETRPLFYPVHTMPMYSRLDERHPVAESLGSRGINLPSYPGLTRDDVEYIAGAVRDFYSARSG
jgi:perosamine synthetase